jgi:hypothetical protein
MNQEEYTQFTDEILDIVTRVVAGGTPKKRKSGSAAFNSSPAARNYVQTVLPEGAEHTWTASDLFSELLYSYENVLNEFVSDAQSTLVQDIENISGVRPDMRPLLENLVTLFTKLFDGQISKRVQVAFRKRGEQIVKKRQSAARRANSKRAAAGAESSWQGRTPPETPARGPVNARFESPEPRTPRTPSEYVLSSGSSMRSNSQAETMSEFERGLWSEASSPIKTPSPQQQPNADVVANPKREEEEETPVPVTQTPTKTKDGEDEAKEANRLRNMVAAGVTVGANAVATPPKGAPRGEPVNNYGGGGGPMNYFTQTGANILRGTADTASSIASSVSRVFLDTDTNTNLAPGTWGPGGTLRRAATVAGAVGAIGLALGARALGSGSTGNATSGDQETQQNPDDKVDPKEKEEGNPQSEGGNNNNQQGNNNGNNNNQQGNNNGNNQQGQDDDRANQQPAPEDEAGEAQRNQANAGREQGGGEQLVNRVEKLFGLYKKLADPKGVAMTQPFKVRDLPYAQVAEKQRERKTKDGRTLHDDIMEGRYGTTFTYPTLRPEYVISGKDEAVMSAYEQLRGDVEFDLFSVVKPGFGLGATNTLHLDNERREEKVRFKGPLFQPRAFTGPELGVIQPFRQVKPNMTKQQMQAEPRLVKKRVRQARDYMATFPGGASNQVLPGDNMMVGSSTGLKENNPSPLMPHIDTHYYWQQPIDPAGYVMQARKFRKLYDPLRKPQQNKVLQSGLTNHGERYRRHPITYDIY